MTKKAIFLLLFLLINTRITSAEHELPTYPPYPDVWEREFFGCLDEDAIFIPEGKGEVIIDQTHKAGKNGAPLRDENGQLLDSEGVFAFFSGKFILDPYASKLDLKKGEWAYGQPLMYFKQTHSCTGGATVFQSTDVPVKDGGKINSELLTSTD